MHPVLALRAAKPAGHAPGPVLASAVQEFHRDARRAAIPRVEAQVVVRFGSSIAGGVDVHALGPRTRVHRKFIRGGQCAVLVRLRPGSYEATLGATAGDLGRAPVPLSDLWGDPASARLREQLAAARDMRDAAALLEQALGARFARSCDSVVQAEFLETALERLQAVSVGGTARELGVSERHLRRVLRQATGVSPKTYARVKRFTCAVGLAQRSRSVAWSAIAADAGYYDQAHLIADFHAIAGCTPGGLLAELDGRSSR